MQRSLAPRATSQIQSYMSSCFVKVFAGIGLLAVLGGCGGGVDLEAVSGKVTLDGAPLPDATLMLVPNPPPTTADADPRAKGPYVARTDSAGQFALGPISEPGGGVPAGTYTLTITTAHVESYDENTVVPPERVPPPYPSGVDFEVPDGGTSEATFDFSSK